MVKVESKKEWHFLIFLVVLTSFLRLTQLGYSHFYGDETKVLYVDKTIPATQFLLDQRKGPVQFVVAWVMETVTEKIFGFGYDEFWIRLPFALAGILSVLAFYLLVKHFLGYKVAAVAALLLCVSGFSVAFGRTAQYQSFLQLFGLLSILAIAWYTQNPKRKYLVLASFSFTLAFLSHYDAVFYLVPICYLVFTYKVNFRELSGFFILPCLAILSIFYLPYVGRGFFEQNTAGYVFRRIVGMRQPLNNSLYTIFLYNPTGFFYIEMILGGIGIYFLKDKKLSPFYLWFFISFIVFGLIILNPGTHIQNYLLPLIVFSSAVIYHLMVRFPLTRVLFGGMFIIVYIATSIIFIPFLSLGYPWVVGKPSGLYQVFCYGFPYNRSWVEIQKYMYSLPNVGGVYTNDDDTVAQYYLAKIPYTRPGTNFLPQYYINVVNPMEYQKSDNMAKYVSDGYYDLKMEFKRKDNTEVVAQVYKLTNY
ncbi:hypothetical protein A3K34_01745 [candidate division WWE3 bacterium RIFOXYC1_FULL_40_10]|uniref:Glycosyltransferase RgtA/B/C/D-like domain-containing protein n=1 Tax=candidate division WWE3 bacterium RIFOXYA2_FULL_46_9 TaxID=1802636 RepID=A0A1F4W3N5_UNCKA|nr:MAG: hypothetical protein A3K58_01745 [candidate division WWE3 bacterium RIFOXYB1_FULL_40_22]OGC61586.1 MAG: hypothetical protein A3K37_01745 [candidate division WWE3 bacterium RIFOXYA1_FULL_40_11]OGC63633.1 MAG: hypothetical protein A2264_04690 [candidate division WWE3 bacterium RIFOXYA2_FULL_46_9]OGC64736.1 MAG: hypothetical protein A2326_01705 [candidate division WWE3 bacterium RIFOXYB2_FULL_41_6]OGC65969.1 MAG: hypothetical protein A3K34_01745 [candidate division WWE3 bacterium RIFOXYC1_